MSHAFRDLVDSEANTEKHLSPKNGSEPVESTEFVSPASSISYRLSSLLGRNAILNTKFMIITNEKLPKCYSSERNEL